MFILRLLRNAALRAAANDLRELHGYLRRDAASIVDQLGEGGARNAHGMSRLSNPHPSSHLSHLLTFFAGNLPDPYALFRKIFRYSNEARATIILERAASP
jgi:hypothetical protein